MKQKITLLNKDGEIKVFDTITQASLYIGKNKNYIRSKSKKNIFRDDTGFWRWKFEDDVVNNVNCFDCFNYYDCSRSKHFGTLHVPKHVPDDGWKIIENERGKSLKITKCNKMFYKNEVSLKVLIERTKKLNKQIKTIMED